MWSCLLPEDKSLILKIFKDYILYFAGNLKLQQV